MTLIGLTTSNRRHCAYSTFQSLFSWMTLIGAAPMAVMPRPTYMFQSLFSWMTLIGEPARSEARSGE